jgi:hypothetical protein
MKKFTSLLVLIFVFTSFTHAQTDASYSATLKKMFDASGSSETFQTVISQIFTTFKQRTGDANSAFFDEFEKEFLKASINDLVEMLVPVYQKYLTQKDLEKMIKFYKTPTGKKYAKATRSSRRNQCKSVSNGE